MSGSTHGERKLAKPAPNAIATPTLDVTEKTGGEKRVGDERDATPVRGTSPRARLLSWYFRIKYRVFRRERRPADGRRGLVMLQIDALAYAELRRAIELGYCPTISDMVREEGYTLRRW